MGEVVTVWTHTLLSVFVESRDLVVLLVTLAVGVVLWLPVKYYRAPSRILNRLESETCQHFIATDYLPPGLTEGATVVSLEARPAHFTAVGWPDRTLFLYLGHKKRGSTLNGKLGDRKSGGAPLTLVSIRGSDLLGGGN